MARFRIGKRKKQRTKMVLPVRVRRAGANSGLMQMAHTLDATEEGVRLAGFRGEVNVGDVLEIQHRHERALFRVVWILAIERSTEKHIGCECVEPDRNIWDAEFPNQVDEYEEKDW
jgi:hypothetical protein